MKKVYITICMLLMTGFLMAQQVVGTPKIRHNGAVPINTKSLLLNNSSTRGLGDTAGFSANYLPAIVMADLVGGYGMTATGIGKIGYWWGTNYSPADTAYDVWIQCYETIDGSAIHIDGIGFYCVNKSIMSGNGTTDSVIFSIQKIMSDGCMVSYNNSTPAYGPGPKAYLNSTGTTGTLLINTRMAVADIDTSLSAGLVFNYMAFPSSLAVTASNPASMFAVTADFFQPRMHGDTVYLICDADGDGMSLKYSQSGERCPNGTSYYYPMSNFFNYNGSDGGLDNNGALFAVMSSTIGMNENFINGIKLGVRNEANGGAILDYAIQSNANVTFRIHDISGHFVKEYTEGNKVAGQYSVNLNTSNLAAGEYIVIMNAGGKALAKKFIIE